LLVLLAICTVASAPAKAAAAGGTLLLLVLLVWEREALGDSSSSSELLLSKAESDRGNDAPNAWVMCSMFITAADVALQPGRWWRAFQVQQTAR
jgi:hypothetical protein